MRPLVAGLGLALSFGSAAHAATPVPLAPCRIGGVRLAHDMPLSTLTASLRRAFPKAVVIARAGRSGGPKAEVREGAETLMVVDLYGRGPAKMVSMVELIAPRFQLAPGVGPGTKLTDTRALGAVVLQDNPTDGVEDVEAPAVAAVLDGWEKAGCTAQLRAGPGPKAGLYARGAFETRRFRPEARIARIEIAL